MCHPLLTLHNTEQWSGKNEPRIFGQTEDFTEQVTAFENNLFRVWYIHLCLYACVPFIHLFSHVWEGVSMRELGRPLPSMVSNEMRGEMNYSCSYVQKERKTNKRQKWMMIYEVKKRQTYHTTEKEKNENRKMKRAKKANWKDKRNRRVLLCSQRAKV